MSDHAPAMTAAGGIWAADAAPDCSGAGMMEAEYACALAPPVRPRSPALHDAVRVGDAAAVRSLLDSGALVDAGDEEGDTPLMLSITRNHAHIVPLLLDAGADFNRADEWEGTPLHRAAKHGRPAVVNALIAAGANPNATDTYGHTARAVAAQGSTPLMVAARRGHAAAVRLLLNARAALTQARRDLAEPPSPAQPPLTPCSTQADNGGRTALLHAAAYGHTDVVVALLDAHAATPPAARRPPRRHTRAASRAASEASSALVQARSRPDGITSLRSPITAPHHGT